MSANTMTGSDPTSPETPENGSSSSGEESSPEKIRVSNHQIYVAGVICCWIAVTVVLTIIYKVATGLNTSWF